MTATIDPKFELTEAQSKKLPKGKKLRFHLTYTKRPNGDVYVISNATYTGKDKKDKVRTMFVGSKLLGRFVDGDQTTLVSTRPRNWKALALAEETAAAVEEAIDKVEDATSQFSSTEIETVQGLIKFVRENIRQNDGEEPWAVVRYNREHIYLVAVLCAIHGGFDAPSIADYWNRHGAELAQCIPHFRNERISEDTVWKVLCTTPESVNSALLKNMYYSLVNLSTLRFIGLDGQVARASRNEETGLPFQLAGVYDSVTKLWIDHIRIEAKTNEIPTFPALVETLDLHNTIVTADALNTVTPLAEAILRRGGHYCLAVKDNKGGLADAIKDHFTNQTWLKRDAKTVFDDPHTSHGRRECRDYFFLPASRLIGFTEKWPELAEGTICMIKHYSVEQRKRWSQLDNKTVQAEKSKAESEEVRYYISSLKFNDPNTPETYARAIRSHWGIESAHYILDVDFGQDWQQCKLPTYLITTSTLRKIATNFLQMILRAGGTEVSESSLIRLSRNLDRPIQTLKAIAKACPQINSKAQ